MAQGGTRPGGSARAPAQHVPSRRGGAFGRLREWGLTLVLSVLFAVSLLGQIFTGWVDYNGMHSENHSPPVSLGDFLQTGFSLNGIFSNTEAALLQLAVLILFTSFLYQRGAAHSRPPGRHGERPPGEAARRRWGTAHEGGSGRGRGAGGSEEHDRGPVRRWLYENSLALTFFAGFLIALGLHLYFGTLQYNWQQVHTRQPTVTVGQYFVTADFWFNTFDVWQAEFFAIAVLTILTVFLRQKGSAESKPVEESDEKTGTGEEQE
jgi:hypothetical protein